MTLKAVGMTQLAEPENPGPPVLFGIEANVAISSLEFPPPEPVRFSPPLFDEPVKDSLAGARKISHPVEVAESKGGCPTALRISLKCWPSAFRGADRSHWEMSAVASAIRPSTVLQHTMADPTSIPKYH